MTKEDLINLLTTGATGIADEDVPGSDGDLKGLLVISRATAIVSAVAQACHDEALILTVLPSLQILLLMYIGCKS